MMPFDSVDAIYDKNEVGDSGMNVEAMKSSAAKSQMLLQYPAITAPNNNYIIATAPYGRRYSYGSLCLLHKRN